MTGAATPCKVENAMSRIAKAAAAALGTGALVIGGTGLAMANAGAEGGPTGTRCGLRQRLRERRSVRGGGNDDGKPGYCHGS